MKRVFITHDTGRQSFNTEDLERYGKVKTCVTGGVYVWNVELCVEELDEALADAKEDDYILPVGSPTLMGLAIANQLMEFGKVNLLWYERHGGAYIPVTLEFDDDDKLRTIVDSSGIVATKRRER